MSGQSSTGTMPRGHALPFYILIIVFLFSFPRSVAQKNETNNKNMDIVYKPIGIFHTSLTPASGAPRQGTLEPGIKGSIEIFEDYARALEGLDQHRYIIVLYHMNLSTGWHTPVHPPGSARAYGMFATRTPNRPNPIGFGVIRLISVKDNVLEVGGIDAYDGTPVLDIKPWLPSVDCPLRTSPAPAEAELGLPDK